VAPRIDCEALAKSLLQQSEVLLAASTMELKVQPAEADISVRQMLSRAAELMRAAAALGKEANATGLAVLARALLENLILILWVQVDSTHAKLLQDAGIAELARMAKVNLKNGKAQILNRKTGEDATAEFLASDRFKNLPRRKSVEDRAREAGVEDLYNVFYRSLSMEMHGHALGGSESRSELAFMHMQGIGALGMGSGHAGARWLVHRQRTDNETLRNLMGLGNEP
jgi:hypothetical protein